MGGDAAVTGPTVHTFGSTFEAYNATQCVEEIRDGDVLMVESEKVIGIAWTWPFALTASFGELHVTTADPRTYQGGIFAAGVELAEQVARERGWRVIPLLDLDRARALVAQHTSCGEAIGFKALTRKNEAGRERTGWLVAGTTGFIELDEYEQIVFIKSWAPLTNEQKGLMTVRPDGSYVAITAHPTETVDTPWYHLVPMTPTLAPTSPPPPGSLPPGRGPYVSWQRARPNAAAVRHAPTGRTWKEFRQHGGKRVEGSAR